DIVLIVELELETERAGEVPAFEREALAVVADADRAFGQGGAGVTADRNRDLHRLAQLAIGLGAKDQVGAVRDVETAHLAGERDLEAFEDLFLAAQRFLLAV